MDKTFLTKAGPTKSENNDNMQLELKLLVLHFKINS